MPIRKLCDNFINYYLVLIVQPTNMHQAAYHNDIARLSLLIERGVNINKQYIDSGDTPLHIAANKGNVQAVELLLSNGANPEILNYQGKTPVDLAKQKEILYTKKTHSVAQKYSQIIDILYRDIMLDSGNQKCIQDSAQELSCSPIPNQLESELFDKKEVQYQDNMIQNQATCNNQDKLIQVCSNGDIKDTNSNVVQSRFSIMYNDMMSHVISCENLLNDMPIIGESTQPLPAEAGRLL